MKARLPKGFGGGPGNLQQIAKQAQQMQQKMDTATTELESKEYEATVGGGAVKVVTGGDLEVKSIDIKPEVVDADDVEMLSDLIIAAVNESIRAAEKDKEETLEGISGGLNVPGLF